MHDGVLPESIGWLNASLHLFRVTVRRLFWSRQTIVCAVLVGLVALAVYAESVGRERTVEQFVEQIILTIYVSFLLPVLCLCYATAGIPTEREEQTLVYLLVTPLPRPLIFLAKWAAALILALAWTLGGLALLGWVVGDAGIDAARMLWRSIAFSTVAYVTLFTVFSVTFRRATILALVYALFLEVLTGNMPGIAKRVAVSYYTRCMIYEVGADFGVGPSGPSDLDLLVPISGSAAETSLVLLSCGLLLLGGLIFSIREYSR